LGRWYFPYYSYPRNPTGREFFVHIQTALFVAALIIGHALSLFVVTRPPSTLPSLVDCCLFTPAVATAVITVAVAVASATTIAAIEATIITAVVVNATAINTVAAANVAATAIAAAVTVVTAAAAVITIVTIDGRPRRQRRHGLRRLI
jgi:hypothetical protein